MTNMTERRDRLAEKRSKRQCTTGNQDLDKAIAWYLKIGFEDGFDAGVAEMQAKVDELKQKLNLNKSAQRCGMCGNVSMFSYGIILQEERDTLKQALDVAVKALKTAHDFVFDSGYQHYSEYDPEFQMYKDVAKARASINEIINKTKQGE